MSSGRFDFKVGGVEPEVAIVLHELSVESMADSLLKQGYIELESALDDEDLDYRMSLAFHGSVDASSASTVFDFYRDLFSIELKSDEPSEILISFSFDEAEDTQQNYMSYVGSDLWDAESLVTALRESEALVFPGTFRPIYRNSGELLNARLDHMQTWNALVVDVDPRYSPTPGSDLVKCAIDPECIKVLFNKLPRQLYPTHISLSGNGFHLWYIFDSPVMTGSTRNPRRQRFTDLIVRFAHYIQSLLAGMNADVDMNCARLNHGFRAPGSLSKYNDLIRVFKSGNARMQDPVRLSRLLAVYDTSRTDDFGLLNDDDIAWEDASSYAEYAKERMQDPMTDAQARYLYDLAELGFVEGGTDFLDENDLTVGEAGVLIRKGLEMRGAPQVKGGRTFALRETWGTNPHGLVAGSTGGVYNTIYKRITEVDMGHRYMALHMLAGVAYMMINPQKQLSELRKDFAALLDTPWARAGKPITMREVNKALKGYCAANYRTRNSMENALGFSPFGEPQKRNGRSREAHLGQYVPELRAATMKGKCLDKICEVLRNDPSATKAGVSRATGLSRPTVSKYWDEAVSIVGTPISPAHSIAKCIKENPGANKTRVSELLGMSRPTVSKYWDEAKSLLG